MHPRESERRYLRQFRCGVHDQAAPIPGSNQGGCPSRYSERVIITRDKRFVKVLELLPVNFYTLSETEQGNAIADFAAYLKVAPDQLLRINVLTQKFNLNGYLKLMMKNHFGL